MAFFNKPSAAAIQTAEAKKQELKAFGSWRAFAWAYFLINVVLFVGLLISSAGGIFLYGIPTYIAFAGVLTFTVYISTLAQQNPNSPYKAVFQLVLIALSLVMLQMVLSYVNEYWLTKPFRPSAIDIILAITLRQEIPALMAVLAPGWDASRQTKTKLQRMGILSLSLTALLPLLGGWLLGHLIGALLPVGKMTTVLQGLALASPLVVMVFATRGVPSFLQGRVIPVVQKLSISRLIILMVGLMGLGNGLITGVAVPAASDPFMSQSMVHLILYALLFMQMLTVLTLWYLFVIIPRYSSGHQLTTSS